MVIVHPFITRIIETRRLKSNYNFTHSFFIKKATKLQGAIINMTTEWHFEEAGSVAINKQTEFKTHQANIKVCFSTFHQKSVLRLKFNAYSP